MKLKMYLRMLLAAVAALFVATACDDSEETTDPGGGIDPAETPLTFEIAVSNIEGSKATLSVTPSVQLATYYWSAVKKSIYDGLGSDEAFLEDDQAFIQSDAKANQMTLTAYLQWVTGRGTATYTLTGLEATTEYYAYVYGIKTDGTVTTGVTKVLFTSGEGGDEPDPGTTEGPEVEFALTPGDPDGANTNTTITMSILAPNGDVVSGKYAMAAKATVDEILASAGSYEALVKQYGRDMSAQWIAAINGKGIALFDDSCLPGTEYTAIALLANEGGETVVYDSCSTTGEASDEGPELTMSLRAGDSSGANTHNSLYTIVTAPNKDVTSFKIGCWKTSVVEESGMTPLELVSSGGQDLSDAVAMINDEGCGITMGGARDPLEPNTSYTVIILGVNAEGGRTAVSRTATTTDETGGGGGETSEIELVTEIVAGRYSSAEGDFIEKQTCITVGFFMEKGTAASGKFVVATTSAFDEVLGKGATWDQIIEENGTPFEESELTSLNADGLAWYYSKRTPGTSYTVAAKVVDANGNVSISHAAATTDPAGEATDAYKAWLGTWTVTSTSSEKTGTPKTFDITIEQKVANSTYTVGGMFTAVYRDDPETYGSFYPVANFDSATGGFTLANQVIFSDEDDEGAYDFMYMVRFKDVADGKTYVSTSPGLGGLIGSLTDATSGTIVGNTLKYSSGETAGTVSSMDYFFVYTAVGGKIYGVKPSDMFASGNYIDYPIGPYTITKKTDAAATPAFAKAAKNANVKKEIGVHKFAVAKSGAAIRPAITTNVTAECKSFENIHLNMCKPETELHCTLSEQPEINSGFGLRKFSAVSLMGERKVTVKARAARNE